MHWYLAQSGLRNASIQPLDLQIFLLLLQIIRHHRFTQAIQRMPSDPPVTRQRASLGLVHAISARDSTCQPTISTTKWHGRLLMVEAFIPLLNVGSGPLLLSPRLHNSLVVFSFREMVWQVEKMKYVRKKGTPCERYVIAPVVLYECIESNLPLFRSVAFLLFSRSFPFTSQKT